MDGGSDIMVRHIFDLISFSGRPRFFFYIYGGDVDIGLFASPVAFFSRFSPPKISNFPSQLLSIFEWRDENIKKNTNWNVFFFFTLCKLNKKKTTTNTVKRKIIILFCFLLSGGLPQPAIRNGKIIDHFMLYISRNCTHTVSNEQNVFLKNKNQVRKFCSTRISFV